MGSLIGCQLVLVERDAQVAATAFSCSPGARRVEQNPTHHRGRDGKEMRTVLPSDAGDVNQTQVNFIYKGSSFESVTGPFTPHVIAGYTPELVEHDRH